MVEESRCTRKSNEETEERTVEKECKCTRKSSQDTEKKIRQNRSKYWENS